MIKDLIIGLDSSTQSAKAIAWNAQGKDEAEGRADFELLSSQPGYAEQYSAEWWRAACDALQSLMAQIDPLRIAGIAISNQRETVAFFDKDGGETHPAITWLDDRTLSEIPLLTQEFGAERLHQITGRPPFDASVAVHTLSWMRRHRPDIWERTNRFLDVHGFLTQKLTGVATASTTSIDAFTVYDLEKMQPSRPLMAHLGLSPASFAQIKRPGTPIGTVSHAASKQTGVPEHTPVIAAGGDGQCAALGVNAITAGTAYINLGTAIVAGVYAKAPHMSNYWRTVTSPTGQGYILEGCQRAGTFLIDWLVGKIGGLDVSVQTLSQLEQEAALLPMGADGVTMSPYLMGCMDPHWDHTARASLHGLGADHSFVHIFRASLEATTRQTVRYIQAVQDKEATLERIVAVGGGASNKLWTTMLADASGVPIVHCQSKEASSLGAAMTGAVGLGWYDSFEDAAQHMVRFGQEQRPDCSQTELWRSLFSKQDQAVSMKS